MEVNKYELKILIDIVFWNLCIILVFLVLFLLISNDLEFVCVLVNCFCIGICFRFCLVFVGKVCGFMVYGCCK